MAKKKSSSKSKSCNKKCGKKSCERSLQEIKDNQPQSKQDYFFGLIKKAFGYE